MIQKSKDQPGDVVLFREGYHVMAGEIKQVQYTTDNPEQLDPKIVYFIWCGGNEAYHNVRPEQILAHGAQISIGEDLAEEILAIFDYVNEVA